MNGTQYMVVSDEVVKTEVLDSSPNSANRGRISAKFVLRVHDAYLHGLSLPVDGGDPGSRKRRFVQSVPQVGRARRLSGTKFRSKTLSAGSLRNPVPQKVPSSLTTSSGSSHPTTSAS